MGQRTDIIRGVVIK